MPEQRLAAIMFSDIVGYSKLMTEDNSLAMKLVAITSKIHKDIIQAHGGILHKEMGDGFMATFPSASDAGKCSIELILETQKHTELKLHIGLHLGEVTFQEGDIFGDGVNIAARIQAQALADQILISESIYSNLRNQSGFQMKFADEIELKNIKGEQSVYELEAGIGSHIKGFSRSTRKRLIGLLGITLAVLAIIFALNNYFSLNLRGEGQVKIAVLPFEDLSENETFFSKGLCYEIRNKLNSVKGFKVASPQSSIIAWSSKLSLQEIGKELNVSHVLEGSLQVFEDVIHFNLFLTNINNDESVPIGLRDYPAENINDAQIKIAHEVVDLLDQSLSPQEEQSVSRVPTENPTAYRNYLLSLNELNKGPSKLPLAKAEKLLKEAILLDTSFAEAYIAMAETYNKWGMYGYMDNRESAKLARVYAEKALELDPHSANAHVSLAFIHFQELAPNEALEELDKALEEDPYNEDALLQKFRVYVFWYNRQKAREVIALAHMLNPLSTIYTVDGILVKDIEYEEMISELEEVIQSEPGNYYAKWHLGLRYAFTGQYEKSIEVLKTRSVDSLENNWYLGYVFAKTGKTDEAERILKYQLAKSDTVYVPPSMIALIYWGLEERQKAYEWMFKAYEVRDNFPIMMPAFDVMKNEPWFEEFFSLGTLENPRNPYK